MVHRKWKILPIAWLCRVPKHCKHNATIDDLHQFEKNYMNFPNEAKHMKIKFCKQTTPYILQIFLLENFDLQWMQKSRLLPQEHYLLRFTFYLKIYLILGIRKINLKILSKKSIISLTEKTVFKKHGLYLFPMKHYMKNTHPAARTIIDYPLVGKTLLVNQNIIWKQDRKTMTNQPVTLRLLDIWTKTSNIVTTGKSC